MTCGVALRQDSGLVLLWLWWRLAAAALIVPLAWELPYSAGLALKSKKKKNKKKIYFFIITPILLSLCVGIEQPQKRRLPSLTHWVYRETPEHRQKAK